MFRVGFGTLVRLFCSRQSLVLEKETAGKRSTANQQYQTLVETTTR
jgi:hypothetical protein